MRYSPAVPRCIRIRGCSHCCPHLRALHAAVHHRTLGSACACRQPRPPPVRPSLLRSTDPPSPKHRCRNLACPFYLHLLLVIAPPISRQNDPAAAVRAPLPLPSKRSLAFVRPTCCPCAATHRRTTRAEPLTLELERRGWLGLLLIGIAAGGHCQCGRLKQILGLVWSGILEEHDARPPA